MRKDWSEKIDEFLSKYEGFQKSSNQKGYRYNLLADQCGSVLECSHTKFLIRLLQYKNQYGFPFLKEFIAMAGFDLQVDSHDIQFDTEYFGRDDKSQIGRLDGLIYTKGVFAIIIENKINHAGNQPEQIKKYIEIAQKDLNVSNEHIYVVFLTRDGLESPDKESKECMVSCGICNPEVLEEKREDSGAIVLSGSRYFACSYAGNILDWLKESIQPSVAQKEVVLNAGLIQYIDYLEGMLGIYDDGLKRECRKWFDENIHIDGDETNQNAVLYEIYMWLDKKEHANIEGINMLKNVINDKNDELMGTFLSITKDFFTFGEKPLMPKYHLNHHFTYYYITLFDKAWPKRIHFGWYPLGMKKLRDDKELSFFFDMQGEEFPFDNELGKKLRQLGYTYHEQTKSYRVKIDVSLYSQEHTFFAMDDKEKASFLTNVYQNFALPFFPFTEKYYIKK